MSVKGKKLRSAKRQVEKRNTKAQHRAQYEAFAKIGKARKRDGGPTGTGEHRDCGNPACKKCNMEFHERLARTSV